MTMTNFDPNTRQKFFRPKLRLGMFLSMFLFLGGFQPGCSYKRCSYKKKGVSKKQKARVERKEYPVHGETIPLFSPLLYPLPLPSFAPQSTILLRCHSSGFAIFPFSVCLFERGRHAQWSRTAQKSGRKYCATYLSVCSFAPSLAPLTHLRSTHCSLSLHAPLRSFVCLLARSLTPELVGKWITRCLITTWFCPTVPRGRNRYYFCSISLSQLHSSHAKEDARLRGSLATISLVNSSVDFSS